MTRLCFLCGKKIGFLRSLTDQQYCSSEHRREARLAAAHVLREEEEMEPWSVEKSKNKKKTFGMYTTTAGQTASMAAFLTVAALLVVAFMLPKDGATYPPSVSADPGVKRGFFDRAGDAVGELIRSSAPVTLHQDFHSSALSGWMTMAMKAGSSVDDPRLNLAAAPDLIRPGSLRLWTKSTSLQNYQMEFMGQMEKHSLSWAFRATDPSNYYAGQLVITKPGPLPNASLVRYAMVNGRESERESYPLPLTLERGVNYRVRVSVEDNRFLTYLDGRYIGSWTDRRLHRGGVGFFADDDDTQEIAWVNVSERDSFLGRMLSHFSLFVVPGTNLR